MDDLHFPTVTGNADGTDFIHVFHPKVYRTGTDGFGKTVVGIVLLVGENFQPTADQRLRNGLCPDVHQSPAGEVILGQIDFSPLDGVENVLGPGHQKPDDGALFRVGGLKNGFRPGALQNYGLRAGNQTSEPVHLCPRVIEGRNAKETVVLGLLMMVLFHAAGVDQTLVIM